jgi:hypothetical protein
VDRSWGVSALCILAKGSISGLLGSRCKRTSLFLSVARRYGHQQNREALGRAWSKDRVKSESGGL